VAGDLTVGSDATLAPGLSIGTLNFSNALTLLSASATLMEISKAPLTNDQVKVASALTFGGALTVTNITTNALGAGDSFKLFSAANYAGSFSSLSLPPLGAGLAWNTNGLATNGTLAVVSVAPPVIGSLALLGDGNLRLTFSGSAGQVYEIRATTNLALAPATSWTLLGGGTFGGAAVVFDDLQATNFAQRFYLIHIP
jgi:hypothetical protein